MIGTVRRFKPIDIAFCCGTTVQESDGALDAPPRSAISASQLVQLFVLVTKKT